MSKLIWGLMLCLVACQSLETPTVPQTMPKVQASSTASPSAPISSTPKPVADPLLVASPTQAASGEVVTLTASGVTPNQAMDIRIAYPTNASGFALTPSYSRQSDSEGKLTFTFDPQLQTTVTIRKVGEEPETQVFSGTYRAQLIDTKTKKSSSVVSFVIDEPPAPPVNPVLIFDVTPTEKEGSNWLKVTGSGFSASGQVEVIYASPPGLEMVSTRLSNASGKFTFSFIVQTSLNPGQHCFVAIDKKTNKSAQEVCKDL